MTDMDQFIQNEFWPFCQRVSNAFVENHPSLHAMLRSFLSGPHQLGMRVTDQDHPIGDYTLVIEHGLLVRIENGPFSSAVHTPFGILKPYALVEKQILLQMLKDEPNFIKNLFATKLKYYPDITIKFQR